MPTVGATDKYHYRMAIWVKLLDNISGKEVISFRPICRTIPGTDQTVSMLMVSVFAILNSAQNVPNWSFPKFNKSQGNALRYFLSETWIVLTIKTLLPTRVSSHFTNGCNQAERKLLKPIQSAVITDLGKVHVKIHGASTISFFCRAKPLKFQTYHEFWLWRYLYFWPLSDYTDRWVLIFGSNLFVIHEKLTFNRHHIVCRD